MDRKKAIEVIQALLDCNFVGSLSGEDIEALKMAIRCLKVDEMYQLLFEDPGRVIIVPENATNGDMMIAIYGIVDVEVNERSVRLFPKDGGQLWVTRDWWEAPYKRGNANE